MAKLYKKQSAENIAHEQCQDEEDEDVRGKEREEHALITEAGAAFALALSHTSTTPSAHLESLDIFLSFLEAARNGACLIPSGAKGVATRYTRPRRPLSAAQRARHTRRNSLQVLLIMRQLFMSNGKKNATKLEEEIRRHIIVVGRLLQVTGGSRCKGKRR